MARDIDGIIKQKYAENGDVGLSGLDLDELWTTTYSTPGGLFPSRLQFNQLFRYLSALGVEINSKGPFLDYDGTDPTGPDYNFGAIVTASDGLQYRCLIANGPGSIIVDPVGDLTETWVRLPVYLSNYGCDIAVAVASIGSVIKTKLIVDCACVVAEGTSVTITDNIATNVINGGSFDGVAGGGVETLNILGPFSAGLYRTFLTNLTVDFTGNISTRKAFPQWWGGIPDAVTAGVGTDNAAAINTALACGLPTTFLTNGRWGISSSINITVTSMTLEGESKMGAMILPLVSTLPTYDSLITIQVQPWNGTLRNFRFPTGGLTPGYTGDIINAKNDGTVKNLFGADIYDLWVDPGSTAAGFFTGGIVDSRFHDIQFESIKRNFYITGSSSANIFLSDLNDHAGFVEFFFNDTPVSAVVMNNIIIDGGQGGASLPTGYVFRFDTVTDLALTNLKYQSNAVQPVGLFQIIDSTGINIGNFSTEIFAATHVFGAYIESSDVRLHHGELNDIQGAGMYALQVAGTDNRIQLDHIYTNGAASTQISVADAAITGSLEISNSTFEESSGYIGIIGGATCALDLAFKDNNLINAQWGAAGTAPFFFINTLGRLLFTNNEIGRTPAGVSGDASNPLSIFDIRGVGTGVMKGNNLIGFDASALYAATASQRLLSDFSAEAAQLADDGIINLPNNASGIVTVTSSTEIGIWKTNADGSVILLHGSTNTAATDSDNNLCVFDGGLFAVVKNRLGGVERIMINHIYN